MPNQNIRVGVPQIFISLDDNTTVVPNLSSLTFTASSVAPVDYLLNDVNQPLSASDTYQVAIALVGRDLTNGGYTIAPSTISSGNLSVDSVNTMIRVKVSNGAWPSGFSGASCAAIFLKTNASNFQLAKFAYVDPANDFYTVITSKPLRVAPSFPIATLTTYALDTAGILGDRHPKGITFQEITPTTGSFNVTRSVSTVTIDPNNGPSFPVATTRAASIRFQSLGNDVKAIVQAAAGNYVKFLDGGGVTLEEAEMGLATAQAVLRGNRVMQVVMPADPQGFQEIRTYVGNLQVNMQQVEEAWSKTASTPIQFQFDPAAMDKLITNQHTEIQSKRWA